MKKDIRTCEPEGLYHMILCRNLVFTHFSESIQAGTLDTITGHVHERGMIVIGKNESLPYLPENLERHPKNQLIFRKI